MAVLDFKEIPEAHVATGQQDSFELFAREFLAFMGYEIERNPDRGADGGRDIIAREMRSGVGGQSIVRWLVSCKHKAHSGRSVALADETDITGRVDAKGCQGFIAFYSTVPSSSLGDRLEECRSRCEVNRFDNELIERYLLSSMAGIDLAARFFPVSINNYRTEKSVPADLFSDQVTLHCKNCGRDLLVAKEGIVVIWKRQISDTLQSQTHVEDFYWCCKGNCDQLLKLRFSNEHSGSHIFDSWEDIPDIGIPTMFIRWVMAAFNESRAGVSYSDSAFENYKQFILALFPYVSRNITATEREKIAAIQRIPAFLGGLWE
jgi:hypothetical protein